MLLSTLTFVIMSVLIHTNNLVKVYGGRTVVNHVSIELKQGEIVGLLGPNGAGKSTTMKMITGLIEWNAGDILFAGKSISDNRTAWKTRVGYVPEEPHLFTHLSGLEYLVMVAQLRELHETLEFTLDPETEAHFRGWQSFIAMRIHKLEQSRPTRSGAKQL